MNEAPRRAAFVGPGILLGVGLGGFFDGIVLHQILQWHYLVSSTGRWPATTVHGLKVNTLGDGLFHAATWAITVVGLIWLWRVGRRSHAVWSTRAFVGTLLLGWGLFNDVEGLVNHELLGIHHVRSGPRHVAWDLAFLAWGAAMIVVGWRLVRAGHDEPTGAPARA